MAKCAICEKTIHFGNNVGHSHRRSGRIWRIDVEFAKVRMEGGVWEVHICTPYLRPNFVERA